MVQHWRAGNPDLRIKLSSVNQGYPGISKYLINDYMKIILSGGGTLGPVTPLLAIAKIIKDKYPQAELVWVGTKTGPEKTLVEKQGIKFFSVSSGKLRRYLSFWNFTDIFKLLAGFWQSLFLIWQERPSLCISAGGFVSVPLHFSAWLFGIPTWIHQQDVEVGLSNKLMAPMAKVITTSLQSSVNDFSKNKTQWLGNPVRPEILQGSKVEAEKKFNLKLNLPVVLAMGGGTGSLRVNQLIVESIQHLTGVCQIIHLSGLERPQQLSENAQKLFDFYQVHQFFTEEMKDVYATTDLIISRGGFGSLAEIAALGKPAIIIPKPGHQEENVKFLADAGAVIMVNENTADGNYLARVVKELLSDSIRKKQMSMTLQTMLPVAKSDDIIEIVGKLLNC